jgi:hypothetical protein
MIRLFAKDEVELVIRKAQGLCIFDGVLGNVALFSGFLEKRVGDVGRQYILRTSLPEPNGVEPQPAITYR